MADERAALRQPGVVEELAGAAVRHSALGFGLLVSAPMNAAQTRGWVEPCLTDAGVCRDVSRFARAADPAELDAVSGRLGAFDGPALLVWGMADRFFKPAFAQRLRDAFADARLVEIEGGRTFVPHDHPDRLAEEIAAFQVARVSSL